MTDDHARRTGTLGALAALAGFPFVVGALPGGSIPDVLRVHCSGRGLFVGDAKASEHPGDPATYMRLRNYAVCLRGPVVRGRVVLALCVPTSEHELTAWLNLLTTAAQDASLPDGCIPALATLDGVDAVVSLTWPGDAGIRRHNGRRDRART